jgi:hypothetical protein
MLPVQTVRIRTGEGDSTCWLSQAGAQDRSVLPNQLNMARPVSPEITVRPPKQLPAFVHAAAGVAVPAWSRDREPTLLQKQDPMRAAPIHRRDRHRWDRRRPARRKLLPAAVLAVAALTGLAACRTGPSPSPSPSAATRPGHIFVINLENKSFRDVWNDQSDAEYLSQTLRPQGVLLSRYYAIAHASLPNYIAQISGQGPNPSPKATARTMRLLTRAAQHRWARRRAAAACTRSLCRRLPAS